MINDLIRATDSVSGDLNELFESLRAKEYPNLDRLSHVYLDYTGGNLYSKWQIQKHVEFLETNIYGNPHSTNPTSLISTKYVEDTRREVLEYFNAGDDYYCVFTSNATQALKIVGESYPFNSKSQFLLLFDNHNSVNGIREYARGKGASFEYCPVYLEDLRIDEEKLQKNLFQPGISSINFLLTRPNLMFPASNMI